MMKIMSTCRSGIDPGRILFLAPLLAISLVLAASLSAPVYAGGVTLSPASGPVGTGVEAKLTGWPAGALVYAYIDQKSVTAKPTTVPTNGNVTLTFCVPPELAPGIHPTYFVSTLTGMYSGPIFTITAGTAECQYTISSCKPAFFIGLRGIGEEATSENKNSSLSLKDATTWLGDTVWDFYKEFNAKYGETNADVYGVPYQPANPPTEVLDILNFLYELKPSVAEGITKLQDILAGQHIVCPNQRFVIVGYSEGAWVTGDALTKKLSGKNFLM